MSVDRTKLYEDVLKEQAAGNGPRHGQVSDRHAVAVRF